MNDTVMKEKDKEAAGVFPRTRQDEMDAAAQKFTAAAWAHRTGDRNHNRFRPSGCSSRCTKAPMTRATV